MLLKNNWLLQADPTLIFAWNDYSIRRVLDIHKQIDSPYNTYQNTGLPPTPIANPGAKSITAAVKPADTNYLFYALDAEAGVHKFFTDYNSFVNFVASQNYSN